MSRSAVIEADGHFRAGRFPQGMEVLASAARRHDPEALEMLATLALAGDIVERDLPLSRNLFRQAGLAGSRTARATYRGFVATGTGAPADWAGAVDLLREDRDTDPDARRELDLLAQMSLTGDGDPIETPVAETLSDSPEVRLFPALFTEEECDFLMERSAPALAPSVVVDPATGRQTPNPVRTSDSTAFPLMLETPAIHALCRRLAAASETHVGQGEPLQILRYRPSQEYRAHFDAIAGADNQRVLTFLVYLNDDYLGGETEFLATGLKVKGRKGDGLLFRNAGPDGNPDPGSQHAGLPVIEGEKHIASRWIRARRFGPQA